jgi:rhodanese-related sulfurtransferase
MVSGDMGVWIRKHMGTADTETKDTIDEQIQNAHQYYAQLLSDKNEMVDKTLDKRKKAQLLGILFAEYGVLTTEQASIVKNFIDRPMKNFTNPDSLWTFYNAVTIALQQSHPRTWMEDQRVLHYFIDSIYKFPKQVYTAPVVAVEPVEDVVEEIVTPEASEEIPDPNQINIFDVIEEEEMAVCLPPAEVIEEPEVESEFAAEDNIDDVIQYTDPAGNTFEAPVVDTPVSIEETKTEKLSLDDILIRLPNEEKAKEEPDFSLDFTPSDEEEDSDFIPDLF